MNKNTKAKTVMASIFLFAATLSGVLRADAFIDQDAPVLVTCGSSDSAGSFAKTATQRAVEDLNSKLLNKDGVTVVVGTPLAKIRRPFKTSSVTISVEGSTTLACVTLSKD